MEQRRESSNYRHLTYTAEADGVAIAGKLQQSKHGENYSIVQEKPLSRKKFIGIESIDSQSGSTKEKVKTYEDKPLMTTTKNFIGKSCYNVGCLDFDLLYQNHCHEEEKFETNCETKKKRQQKTLRVFVLVGRKGFWLQGSGSGARF